MSRPTLSMVILGRTFKRLRLENGMSQAQAARRMRLSEAKLSAIENGKRTVSMFDVAGICRVYGARRDLEDELIRMSDTADKPGWWESFSTAMLKDFSVFLELEQICSGLYVYESELINGLLQTEGYAAAVHACHPLIDDDTATQAVDLRVARQQRFWERDPLPDICVVMHESALSRPVCDADSCAAQWQRILCLNEMDGVDIRVLPASVGAHPSMNGAYSMLEFGMEGLNDIVYIESVDGCRYEEDPETLQVYRTFFEATRKQSVSVEEAASHDIGMAQEQP